MDKLLEFFANIFSNITSWRSLFTIVLLSTIVLWIDSQMGFSYHYFTQRKIDEIARYNQIVKDPSLDSVTRALIIKERLSVIKKNRAMVEPIDKFPKDTSALFHLSYSWIIALIILLSYPLMARTQPTATGRQIWAQVIAVGIILLMEALLLYFIASTLSMYVQNFFLYTINTLIQALFVFATFWIANRYEQAKKRKEIERILREYNP